MCAFFLLPATSIAEDHQGIREAIQIVVSKVQGQGLVGFPLYKAPNYTPLLEIWQHGHPL